jgi:RNA polymerase sigma-70 factor (ECF subfamily)
MTGDHDDMGTETQQVLAELYAEWYDRLQRCAYRHAGDKANKVDPSQAALEALIRAALHREQFRGNTREQLWAWLRKILVNQVLDGLGRKECQTASLDQSAGRRSPPVPESAAPVQQTEDALDLAWALGQLPEEDRELVCLYHRSDLPRPVIAEMLGLSEEVLRQRAFRARRRLQKLLGPRNAP